MNQATIAYPHWGACETCKHAGRDGCMIESHDFDYYAGDDVVVCENYEYRRED